MPTHLNIKIFGRVQGVFSRHDSKEVAEGLRLKGFVENLPDGTVYIEVEGNRKSLDKFVDWCRVGPPLAKVTRIKVSKSSLKNFREFTISN